MKDITKYAREIYAFIAEIYDKNKNFEFHIRTKQLKILEGNIVKSMFQVRVIFPTGKDLVLLGSIIYLKST